jgi:hypothetical protein
MRQLLLLTLIVLCSGYAHTNQNFLFHISECPDIDTSSFQSRTINPKQSKLKLKIYWPNTVTEEPYAVIVPDAFIISSLQILEQLTKEHLDSYIPEHVEFYNIGKNLPGSLSSFTAILCKSMQSQGTMRLLVNDAFLYHAITFRKRLSHELFHYISQQKSKNYPHWLEEGLAIQFETQVTGLENLDYATFHLENSPWMPLIPATPLKSLEDKMSFYGHAFLFVRFLAKKHDEDFFLHILENPDSDPEKIFPSLRTDFKDFSLAKYINSFDYFGETLEQRERFIIIEDANVNRSTKPRFSGQYMSTMSPISGESFWIEFGDNISISKTPKPNTKQVFIRY